MLFLRESLVASSSPSPGSVQALVQSAETHVKPFLQRFNLDLMPQQEAELGALGIQALVDEALQHGSFLEIAEGRKVRA